jgi:carboxypeptidase C (cathepsin A)
MPVLTRDSFTEVNIATRCLGLIKSLASLSLFVALIGAAPAASPAPAPPPATAEAPDAVSEQTLTLGGHVLPYTAHAGTIVLQNAKGEPTCRMFFTAFTLDGANPSARPVTFFYNGGPGSSTIWLRMGSFAPMRVSIPDAAVAVNAPFDLVPNQYSLLDATDMVFVDAPDTGFSRITGAGKPDDFFGVDEDMRAFGQFVSRYISTYGRWNSPKFLFGESYGTPRTAVVSNYLERRGIGLNGIVLLSAVLDFNLDWDVNFTPTAIGGGDWAFPLYLPTEAASSWYHNALPGPSTTLQALLPEVQQFAMNEYLNALAQGSKLSPSAYNAIVAKLHRYTGLSETYIRQSNLRVPYWRYTTELLRNGGKTVGRLDSRYTSYSLDRIADRPAFDATDSAIDAAFTGAGNYYLRQLLHYNTTLEYRPLDYTIIGRWDWKHNGSLPANTAQDLASAMTFNPRMRVFVAGGYYDFATPYYAAMYTMNHLNIAPELQSNISYGFYESGHMVYLHPGSLQQFHDDLERWYSDVLRR